ncbi:hypothetical protein GGR50DRAFT_636134 [Xylaria sp. CBS 124048]|nr:hypothetical protein GGR50DRAFT_636134 [Xylaria sp. CBS 124048]
MAPFSPGKRGKDSAIVGSFLEPYLTFFFYLTLIKKTVTYQYLYSTFSLPFFFLFFSFFFSFF